MNKVVHSRDRAKGVHGWRWAEVPLFQSWKLGVLFSEEEGVRKWRGSRERQTEKKRFHFQKLPALHTGADS